MKMGVGRAEEVYIMRVTSTVDWFWRILYHLPPWKWRGQMYIDGVAKGTIALELCELKGKCWRAFWSSASCCDKHTLSSVFSLSQPLVGQVKARPASPAARYIFCVLISVHSPPPPPFLFFLFLFFFPKCSPPPFFFSFFFFKLQVLANAGFLCETAVRWSSMKCRYWKVLMLSTVFDLVTFGVDYCAQRSDSAIYTCDWVACFELIKNNCECVTGPEVTQCCWWDVTIQELTNSRGQGVIVQSVVVQVKCKYWVVVWLVLLDCARSLLVDWAFIVQVKCNY